MFQVAFLAGMQLAFHTLTTMSCFQHIPHDTRCIHMLCTLSCIANSCILYFGWQPAKVMESHARNHICSAVYIILVLPSLASILRIAFLPPNHLGFLERMFCFSVFRLASMIKSLQTARVPLGHLVAMCDARAHEAHVLQRFAMAVRRWYKG